MRQVNRVGVRQVEPGHRPRPGQVRYVQHLDTLRIADKGIPKLRLDRTWQEHHVAPQHRYYLRTLRVLEGDDHQAGVATDIGVSADNADVRGAVENTVRIERQLAVQEVVQGVAVNGRCDADDDKPLIAVGHVDVAVEGMDRGLAVFRTMRSGRVRG